MAYCSAFKCNNSQPYYHKAVKMNHVSTLRFHKPFEDRFKQWSRVLRKSVNKNTKVCSNHFIDAKPTKNNPDPTLYLKGYEIKPATTLRQRTSYTVGQELKQAAPLRVSRKMQVVHDHSYVSGGDPIVKKDQNCEVDEGGILSPVHTSAFNGKMLDDEHAYCNGENKDTEVMFSPKTGFNVMAGEMQKLKDERDHYLRELNTCKLEMCRVTENRLSFESLENSDANVKLFTGLPSCHVFLWICDSLKERIGRLHYFKGYASYDYEWNVSGNRRGPPRTLDARSELLLTLMKLKLDLNDEDLAFRFKISTPLVSVILSTYIPFLGREFKRFIVWPRVNAIDSYYPSCFRSFGKVIAIIDCTEVYAQKPSLAEANSKMYSPYKLQTTVKILVACTPSGAISYISEVSGGAMSDRDLVLKSDFLHKIEKSSQETQEQLIVLADRGFNVQDILLKYNIKVVIPPFLRKAKQFSAEDNAVTKWVASTRIHIERVIGKLKVFQILSHTIPSELYDMLDHIVVICGAIVNMNDPIIPLK